MTEFENELIQLIRNASNPAQAAEIATAVILSYLSQRESCQVPAVSCPPELP